MAISLPIVSKFDDKGVNQAASAVDKLRGTLKTFAGVALAAFSVDAIVDFGREVIKGAEYAQQANNRIEAIAKSMALFGDGTARVSKRLQDYADELEGVVAIEAEQIKQAQAQLLTFKNLAISADTAGGAFDRATKAVIDLSAAGLGSLDSSAIQLGKALQDPVNGLTALNRAGVTFTAEQRNLIQALVESNRSLEAQDMILSAIEQQVGGTAEAIAPASEKIRLAFDSIKDAIGLALLPVLEQTVPQIQEFVNNLITSPEFQQFLADMAVNFQNILNHLPTVVAELGNFGRDVLPAVQAFFPMLNDALALLGEMFFGIENSDPASSTNDFAAAMQGLAGAFDAVGKAMKVARDIWDGLPSIFKMNLFESLNPNEWLKRTGNPNRWTPGPSPLRVPTIPRRAAGGGASNTGLSWVGEKGPELITMPRGATVTPIPQHLRADALMGSNRSGSNVVNYNIQVSGGMGVDGAQLGEQIVTAIRKYERTSGAVFARA